MLPSSFPFVYTRFSFFSLLFFRHTYSYASPFFPGFRSLGRPSLIPFNLPRSWTVSPRFLPHIQHNQSRLLSSSARAVVNTLEFRARRGNWLRNHWSLSRERCPRRHTAMPSDLARSSPRRDWTGTGGVEVLHNVYSRRPQALTTI